MTISVSVCTQTASELGEGPVWHNGDFYWIDITGQRLNKRSATGEESCLLQTPSMIGCAVPAQGDSFYLGLEDGIYHFDGRNCQPAGHFRMADPALRFNDGKCDARGRFWLGSMDKLHEQEPLGGLYVVDAGLNTTQVLSGITVSNGLCWSADESCFYYVDSPTRNVCAFDYNPETLQLENRRSIFSVPEPAYPDGMTIDDEGMLWLALWDGYAVLRIDPSDGQILEKVDVPCRKVTSVCFGGADRNELYITTASLAMADSDWQAYPNSGRCFVCQPGVTGARSKTFNGLC
ncbi:SMP-30/gluconolactonase/LRE family protein [Porticoccus sp. GXU_MW_L64]